MKELNVHHNLFYRVPVLAYAGLIFLLSSVSKFPEAVPSFFGFDKLAHFSEYFFFGCVIYRWLLFEKNHFAKLRPLILTIVIGTCYGFSDEWHQAFVPGRDATLWDVLFDTLGILTAALAYPFIIARITLLKRYQ